MARPPASSDRETAGRRVAEQRRAALAERVAAILANEWLVSNQRRGAPTPSNKTARPNRAVEKG
jgi:hypothetical protein